MKNSVKQTVENGRKEVEIPALVCAGCAGRDRIIKTLAARVDEQDRFLKRMLEGLQEKAKAA